MFWKNAIAISLAALPLIEAHPNAVPGAPQLLGLRSVEQLRARVAAQQQRRAATPVAAAAPVDIAKRADPDTCGAGVGSCAAGKCCSAEGYCGTGPDYCNAPDCQISYGPACDGNAVPPGPKTSGVARTKVGSVLYGGEGIYQCTTTGQVAITYDDGPYIYTSHILDLLDQYSAKATFFITGNNLGKGEIDNGAYPWANLIKRMDTTGHQIASHTWSHQDLSAITAAQRLAQMYNNEIAFNNILGKFPTYMRPPYSSCTGACQTAMATLGYHVIYFDLDSEDYLHDSPTEIQVSKNDFSGNLSTSTAAQKSWLEISHDIHQQTAYNLTEFMLQTLQSQGYKAVTVGDCLGDPKANWYRTLGGGSVFTSGSVAAQSSTASVKASTLASSVKTSAAGGASSVPASAVASSAGPKASAKLTPDATCGGTNGYTCLGSTYGNCCSVNGWCGSTDAYCGTGCQSGFGNCGSNSPSSAVKASSAAPAFSISRASSAAPAASSAAKASSVAPAASSAAKASSVAPAKSSAAPVASSAKAAASPSASPAKVSDDGSCGSASTGKYTCQNSGFGNCCSQYGWCGSTSAYCGTGCQSGYGSGCTTVSDGSGSGSGDDGSGGSGTTPADPPATSTTAQPDPTPTNSKTCWFFFCF